MLAGGASSTSRSSITSRSSSRSSITSSRSSASKAAASARIVRIGRRSTAQQLVCAMQPQRLNSVSELLQQLPAGSQLVVALDQFGVLHDGRTPYPAAVAAVKTLAEAGAAIVIVSNSSRRSGGTIGKLERMGFDASWFKGAITSGELTHRMLATRPDAWWQGLGTKCIHLTWSSRGAISLDGLGLSVVTNPAEADFILAHGTEAVGLPGGTRDASLDELSQLLQQCAATAAAQGRGIPMIAANPDLVTVDGGPGRLITMPGTLARQYAQLGGAVQLMGKPDARIYAAARELLPGSGARGGGGGAAGAASEAQQEQRVLTVAIGDSVEHDIAGAARAGLQSLFIAGGIHAEEIGLAVSDAADPGHSSSSWDEAALARLWEQHGVRPDFCMDFLK